MWPVWITLPLSVCSRIYEPPYALRPHSGPLKSSSSGISKCVRSELRFLKNLRLLPDSHRILAFFPPVSLPPAFSTSQIIFFLSLCLTGVENWQVSWKDFPFPDSPDHPHSESLLREHACHYLENDLKTNPRVWLSSMDVWAAARLRNQSGCQAPRENVPGSVCIGFQRTLLT